ncbi:MAG: SNF2-related protein [Opitutales bacterium]
MTSAKGNLEGLDGFERLDVSELYYIGSRAFVERGLAYYRQFAVERLEWDFRAKEVTALVAGSRSAPYEVRLRVRDGRLEHECDCPAWEQFGGCKHAVAATAAVLLATQGKSPGGTAMPEDYARELRLGLGYANGPGPGEAVAPEASARASSTKLLLDEVNDYGSVRFRIQGPVPQRFLRSVGITLSYDFGCGGSRDFHLGDPDRSFEKFLAKAGKQGIEVSIRIHGRSRNLLWEPSPGRRQIVFELSGKRVYRKLRFFGADGAALQPYALIPGSSLILTEDGRVCRIVGSSGRVGDSGSLTEAFAVDDFNRRALLMNARYMRGRPEEFVFQIGDVEVSAVEPGADEVTPWLDLSIVENAAGEPEVLEFAGSLEIGGTVIDLVEFQAICFKLILHAYSGQMLAAKRRVRALCDLIRRVLVEASVGEPGDFKPYAGDFPELFSTDYRMAVCRILEQLLEFADRFKESQGLGVDVSGRRWLSYPLDGRKWAMLLFSVADPASRKDLQGMVEGDIPIKRGRPGMEQLQRAMAAARTLGIRVRFNELPIHSEPLSISVDTRTAGTDIDWFALHPSIRCGDRTIRPEEWRQLIQGRLLIRAEDGSLILPELEGESVRGLEVLADMLRQRPKTDSGAGGGAGEEWAVSRLEILDWIALRRHGVRLRLPDEAEALFRSLTEFEGLGRFAPPKTLRAELRPYQAEGCAWIDFLYRHRFGACLADDMGLGKTVQTIAFLAHRFEEEPSGKEGARVLIVLPPSLVFNWLDEFARFAPGIRVVDCLDRASWSGALTTAQVILTTYDRVRTDQKAILSHAFEIVVFDEAHHLKNVAAARTKAAAKLRRRFTLCLTGTPVENNASEFYSVLSAAVPGIFGSLKQFKETFRTAPDRILGRARPFILRRTKKKILKELPPKEEHELFLEMTSLQKEIYTRTVAEVRQEVAEAYEDRPEQQAGIVALAAILRLRQVCVSPELLGKSLPEPAPKFAYMADRLEELAAEGNAALVFSQFVGGLDQMVAAAEARGLDYLRMDGRTPVARRKELVARFQREDGPPFFFISLKTGGVGLNLTRANYVFHLDPWWNPAVENQASDRAHRIGQTRSVFVQRLIMQHSIEARMLELKARKAELFRRLVEQPGAKTAAAGLKRGDFDYLLGDR